MHRNLPNVAAEKRIRITLAGGFNIDLARGYLHGIDHGHERLNQLFIGVVAPDFCWGKSQRIKVDHDFDSVQFRRAELMNESFRSRNVITVICERDKEDGGAASPCTETLVQRG